MNQNRKRLLFISIAIGFTISIGLYSKYKASQNESIHSVELKLNLPVIYELGSNSCSSCIAMGEVMKKIETHHNNNIQVVKIDVFKDEKSTAPFNIRAIPTQVVRDAKGNELFRHEGFISYEALSAKLENLGVLSKNVQVN